MKNYKIRYYFDGRGEVIIEAETEEEAEEIFLKGQWGDEDEWGEDYTIEDIKLL